MKKIIFASLMLMSAFCYADNPVILSMYTADPTARVINGKLFLFPSSDVPPVPGKGNNGFYMPYYHIFSSENMIDWTDYGRQIDQNQVPWGEKDSYAMWAPDCIEKGGKYYYYFPAQPKGEQKMHCVGVAVANRPEGPYKLEKEPIKGAVGIDPSVFIDDDGQAYLYWGSGAFFFGCKLKANMKELDGKPVKIAGAPSNYREASFVFKRNGVYYLTYSQLTPFRNCELSYSMGKSPLGEFEYQGMFMRQWKDCWTNHHSIVNYHGEWILFYHHQDISKKSKMRSVCADYLHFSADGRINEVTPTKRGVGVCPAGNKIQVDRYSYVSNAKVVEQRIGDGFPANWCLKGLAKGDWVCYNWVDFADAGFKNVTACYSAGAQLTDAFLEIHENGFYGHVIAKVPLASTGGDKVFKETSSNVTYVPKGVVNLYLTVVGADGAACNLDWVRFDKK